MKRTIFLMFIGALIWIGLGVHDRAKTSEDFDSCNASASFAQASQNARLHEAKQETPTFRESHDQTDEAIDQCMQAKGYEYHPEQLKECPDEKLPSCYSIPFPYNWLRLH